MNIYTKANELYLKFIQDNEREPSDYELAELLDMDPKDIRNIIRGGHKHTSVDAPISDEEGSVSIIDLMSHGDEDSPDTDLMKDSIKKEIMEGLEILSPRESQILAAHFGLDGRKPMSFDEMSEYFDLSKERLRQIKDRAIRRMRRNVNRNSFNPFFS